MAGRPKTARGWAIEMARTFAFLALLLAVTLPFFLLDEWLCARLTSVPALHTVLLCVIQGPGAGKLSILKPINIVALCTFIVIARRILPRLPRGQ